ncbi:hypothetical protein BT67DRAFT_266875 [Trichocladium antarcticum]|uniref:Uncharacterized protein n=1 Tax=Trichocladium antarcticum TaxID=1450529 RepID=A0AAN6UBB0_9PEZI|nr:hypothetical protein BT67DRAFT_266875 [Trichocladium antarcticum]
MRDTRAYRRLRALFRRKRAEPASHQSVIVHDSPSATPDSSSSSTPRKTTEAELESSADSQAASAFFAKLPLEVRRIIYRHVWATYLQQRRVSRASPGSDMGLHIYTDCSVRGRLAHTGCRAHPGAPAQEDAWVTAPWPFDGDGDAAGMEPPRWFWIAWVMRLNWGRHWKCQHAIQQRWDPATGTARPSGKAPFLPVWLACKKMHVEAQTSFYNAVTLIFTSSLDAHAFFHRAPPLFLGHLRALELGFTNPNDHLYLARVFPAIPVGDTDADTDTDDGPDRAAAAPAPGGSNGDLATGAARHRAMFGPALWAEMARAVRARCPGLRGLDVMLGGAIDQGAVLAGFGGVGGGDGEMGGGRGGVASGELGTTEDGPWVLNGRLAVTFKMPAREGYVQERGRMVRTAVDE